MSTTDREPVIVAFILGAIPLIVAAVTALADIYTGVPDWVVPTATVVGTLTTGLAAVWARAQVTPTAKLEERSSWGAEKGQTNVWFLLGALTVAVVVLAVIVLT